MYKIKSRGQSPEIERLAPKIINKAVNGGVYEGKDLRLVIAKWYLYIENFAVCD